MHLKTKGERIFHGVIIVIMIFFCISILIPFLNILATSFSGLGPISAGEVTIYPKDVTMDAYKFLLNNDQFFRSFFISVSLTLIGTICSLIVTTLCAYPLSKPKLKYRRKIQYYFVFTMMFGGGLIPTFMLIKALGLYDTYWVLFVPSIMSVYNMILIKNFMEGLPESLEESAKIDGATNFQIFRKIVLPLSVPVLATIGLFFAVGYWNSYFPGIMYINSSDLKPLQTFLYEMQSLVNSISTMSPEDQAKYAGLTSSSIQSAAIVATTVPILIVYPFLQKYFVKGLVVGSEK